MCSHLCNDRELESILEENSAVYGAGRKGREVVRAIYEAATEKPHDFLWVNLVAKEREDLFWRNFEERLVLRSADAERLPHQDQAG